MGKLKYLLSIIILSGVTVSFSFVLDYYNQSDFSESKEDIRELELVSVRESYTAEEMLKLLLTGEFQEISFEQVSESDERIRSECVENVKLMLGDGEIFKNIESTLLEGVKLEIAISQCVGYIDGEAVLFNLVSVWLEDILVRYEQKTGVVFHMEYYISTADDGKGYGYLDNCSTSVIGAAEKYYYGYGLTEEQIIYGVYGVNTNRYAVSVQIVFGGYDDSEQDRIEKR